MRIEVKDILRVLYVAMMGIMTIVAGIMCDLLGFKNLDLILGVFFIKVAIEIIKELIEEIGEYEKRK